VVQGKKKEESLYADNYTAFKEMKLLPSQRLCIWQLLYSECDTLEYGRSVLASCRCNGTGCSVSKHLRGTNFLQQGCTNLGH